MELMTKYQYTYFIYPYIIEENKYKKYLQNLLRNKNCKIRFFNEQKDIHLYTYFLPNIRDYMFWSFGLTREGIRDFESMDISLRATLLAEHNCNIFNYILPEHLQGKVETNNGIFFEISEIKIICYKTGVCFLVFKTNIENTESFSDILNFNYKFREVNSSAYNLKEYENIKIQSNSFKNVKDISVLIKELTGENDISKKANIGDDNFFVYTYSCLDQKNWNENTDFEQIDGMFEKFRNVLPANSQIIEDKFSFADMPNKQYKSMYKNQYIRYGFTATSTALLTSNITTANFTTIPQKFESEYLYTYLLVLYKKIMLNKLNYNFSNNFKMAELEFLEFTKKLWIQDITNDEFGKRLEECWMENLNVEKTFLKLKSEYDVTYKRNNIDSLKKNSKLTKTILLTILVINIIAFIIVSLL